MLKCRTNRSTPTTKGSLVNRILAAVVLSSAALVAPLSLRAQQPPNIGIAPVTLTESSYVFDTAEQHKIRVTVVAKGLKHPFSVAFLPSGDALVSERGADLRLVHNAAGAGGKAAVLDPQPVSGARARLPERWAARRGVAPPVRAEPARLLHLQQTGQSAAG
jgi:glucose/arabinose dehydrogenase